MPVKSNRVYLKPPFFLWRLRRLGESLSFSIEFDSLLEAPPLVTNQIILLPTSQLIGVLKADHL